MTKNDITIGRLIGQMEAVQTSLASLHEKFDANAGKCSDCRDDIRKETISVSAQAAKDAVKTVKLWIALVVLGIIGLIIIDVVKANLIQNLQYVPAMSATAEAGE
jgi:hypothetical protein